MSIMTGRCRRHHQQTCEGPTNHGLCTKHRHIWEAMQADWKQRAGITERKPKRPPRQAPQPWTAQELDILHATTGAEAKAAMPYRTHAEISTKRRELGHKRGIRKLWTAKEDEILRRHHTDEAARLLDRSKESVQARRSAKKIPTPSSKARPWTTLEDKIIRHKSIREAERLLDRSRNSVKWRRTYLGVSARPCH